MFNDFYGIKFPQVKDEGQDLYATEDADKKLEELEKAFRIFPLSWDSLQTKWMKHHQWRFHQFGFGGQKIADRFLFHLMFVEVMLTVIERTVLPTVSIMLALTRLGSTVRVIINGNFRILKWRYCTI